MPNEQYELGIMIARFFKSEKMVVSSRLVSINLRIEGHRLSLSMIHGAVRKHFVPRFLKFEFALIVFETVFNSAKGRSCSFRQPLTPTGLN